MLSLEKSNLEKTPVLRKHFLGILLAIAIGVISFVPEMHAIFSSGESFQGVYPMNINDEEYYLARHREIEDGHTRLGNPYLFEHKDKAGAEFWIPDLVLARGSEFLGLGVGSGEFFFDFFAPIFLAILTYTLLFRVSRNKLIGLSGAAFLHLGIFLFVFGRAPSPQINFILWLTLFLSLINFLDTKKWLWATLSAVNLGLLFYVYTYYWNFFVILISVFAILSVVFLRTTYYFKYFLLILFGGFIVGLPYIVNTLSRLGDPLYLESIVRLGLLSTRFPSGIVIVFASGITSAFFLYFLWKRRLEINQISVFVLSALFSTVIAVNQHLITGKNLEFSSHFLLLSVFVVVIAVAYTLGVFFEKTGKRFRATGPALLFLLVIFLSLPNIYSTIERQAYMDSDEYSWQRYAPLFEWLRENTEKDSVVFADPTLSFLIPIYTQNNIFYHRLANLHVMSNEEVVERFVANNYRAEINEEFAHLNERSIWNSMFLNAYGHNQSKNKVRRALGIPEVPYEKIPRSAMDDFLSQAKALQERPMAELLSPYRVDYVVFDRSVEPQHFRKEDFSLSGQVYNAYGIVVYSLKSEAN